ncbi:LuxR C-terminal-related transcriptional regulator [Thauera sp. Sel9]|uniref:LuxR C-terminal-related transcriptional regulator n=1 Tax=Thauera sp. Sel9 TaxID=2974299 RepID=UPI0021E15290|nr:LuxR C-terminal-related transcriptional regulator [Thauera sp. Sel9]MCV2218677.1 LuxR C-terminal-related transcriptional regulator [Thauera sp. Sel9]
MSYNNLPDETLNLTGFMDAPVGIMVTSNRTILKVNTEIELLFGWNRVDLEGQSTRLLYPSHIDFEKTGSRWSRWLLNCPRYEDERFMQRKNGEIIWVRARGRTLVAAEPFLLMVWTFEHLKDRAPSSSALTPKEREVARHIVNGHTSKEIGLAMGISPRTVEVHRAAIMRKLGVHNAAELVTRMIIAR